MAETIEQMVVRLADEADAYHGLPDPEVGNEEVWIFSLAEMAAFARACMVEQAKRDAAICRDYTGPSGYSYEGNRCADAIIKEAEGMK